MSALGQVVGDVSWRDVAAGDTVGLIVVRLSSTDAAVRFAEAPAVMEVDPRNGPEHASVSGGET
jgi:hypothetical protein